MEGLAIQGEVGRVPGKNKADLTELQLLHPDENPLNPLANFIGVVKGVPRLGHNPFLAKKNRHDNEGKHDEARHHDGTKGFVFLHENLPKAHGASIQRVLQDHALKQPKERRKRARGRWPKDERKLKMKGA